MSKITELKENGKYLNIQNRRYYGNKYKLINFIRDAVNEYIGATWKIFFDIFAGTGVVAHSFNKRGKKIIANDFLYHNFVALKCWLETKGYNKKHIENVINHLNSLRGYRGYITKNFGNKFFTLENAKKLDAIREKIEYLYINKEINENEYYILLTSFFYAADKCANIITQYEAYLKQFNPDLFDKNRRQVTYHGAMKPVMLRIPEIRSSENLNNVVYKYDANELIRKIKTDIDILYIDPPYASRQYINNYHLLENIVTWQKPKVYGKARKMNCRNLKSLYSSKTTVLKVFSDLIKEAAKKTKFIVMSYSNRGLMSNPIIENVLTKFAGKKPIILAKDYNGCHVCTSKVRDNREKLFIVKCKR